jgi:hypothetical protein
MTEQDWLLLRSADELESELLVVVQDRKCFLLGAAFLRRVWSRLPAEAVRLALEVTEQYAAGRARLLDLVEAWASAEDAAGDGLWGGGYLWWYGPDCQEEAPHGEEPPLVAGARDAVRRPAQFAARAAWLALDLIEYQERWRRATPSPARLAEREAQYLLYRDVVGDSGEPPRPAPVKLDDHPALKALLAAVEREPSGDPVAMLALADALEEAGCDEPALLKHCRDGGPHVKGCWVLERLRGRCLLQLPREHGARTRRRSRR